MKRILVFLIFMYSVSCKAQNIKFFGNVCDSETRKYIPFATVVSFNGEQVKGTYCDSLGHFSLTFEQLPDSICISSIGYQTYIIKVPKNFDKLYSIKLIPKIYNLEVVTIKPPRTKTIGKVYSITTGKNHGAPGTIRASFVNNPGYKNAYIKEIIYKIDRKRNYDQSCMAMVRVHLYQYKIAEGLPGNELLPENIVLYINSKTPLPLKVDVSKYNIHFPTEGIVVGYEYLGTFDQDRKLVSFNRCQDIPLEDISSRNHLQKSFSYGIINGKRGWEVYYTDNGLFKYFPFGLTINYTP